MQHSTLDNTGNVPWGRILQGPNQYELICVDHHTGKVSYYNYKNGELTVNENNNRNCIGNYYDISVFVSNHWGVRCINADNHEDEFGLNWCRHGQLTGYPGANLIQGDWDNDGIQDLMCFGHDGKIKMAYGTSDGRLIKDPTPRYYHHFTDWLAVKLYNTTSGSSNTYLHEHFKLYARDNNNDGLLDIIAYSTAVTGNIYQMNAVSNYISATTYHNKLNNQTMVACAISDSVQDGSKHCINELEKPVNKMKSICARTAGRCNYDDIKVRGPYFETNPFKAVQYLDTQQVTPFGQGFCQETWATLLQLDLTPLHGKKFDWYCFNYKKGTLKNFYTGEVIFENFCKSIYERNESEFVEMDAQASGQLMVEHNDNGSVDILCIARRDNTAFFFESLPINFQPANSEVVQSDLCLNSACEYCNPVTGDCGCPEKWQLNADGNTCNKVCSETQQLSEDGNSCVIKDYCAAHPEDCIISDTFVDALRKFDVTIACHNHPDQVLSGSVNRKLEWWGQAATYPRETPINDLSKVRLIQEGGHYRLGYAGKKWTYWLTGDSNSYMTRTDITLQLRACLQNRSECLTPILDSQKFSKMPHLNFTRFISAPPSARRLGSLRSPAHFNSPVLFYRTLTCSYI